MKSQKANRCHSLFCLLSYNLSIDTLVGFRCFQDFVTCTPLSAGGRKLSHATLLQRSFKIRHVVPLEWAVCRGSLRDRRCTYIWSTIVSWSLSPMSHSKEGKRFLLKSVTIIKFIGHCLWNTYKFLQLYRLRRKIYKLEVY